MGVSNIFDTKKVYQYDKDSGDFIKEFEQAREATKELKIRNPSNINSACRVKNAISNGFIWSYNKYKNIIKGE